MGVMGCAKPLTGALSFNSQQLSERSDSVRPFYGWRTGGALRHEVLTQGHLGNKPASWDCAQRDSRDCSLSALLAPAPLPCT